VNLQCSRKYPPDYTGVVVDRPKRAHDGYGASVDVSHQLNLLSTLFLVVLINANLIDPDKMLGGLLLELQQNVEQAFRQSEWMIIPDEAVVEGRRSLYVRQNFVTWTDVEQVRLQYTVDSIADHVRRDFQEEKVLQPCAACSSLVGCNMVAETDCNSDEYSLKHEIIRMFRFPGNTNKPSWCWRRCWCSRAVFAASAGRSR
jgi:hypothetical protein